MEIDHSIALVTGAAGGLGAGTARRLAAEGARVVVVDQDGDKATVLANELGGLGLAADVTDVAQMEGAFAAAKARLGVPRIVVHCAGIGHGGRILPKDGALSVDLFDRVIRVNLIGTYVVMNIAAREMAKLEPLGADGERGVIINTASVAWQEGQIGQAAYAASKGGVVSMTLPAARELARFGIRVMAIAPGLFETPMSAGLPAEVRERLESAIPFPSRLGLPDEFARLAEQIVRNPMLNGSVIRLDGAVRMQPK